MEVARVCDFDGTIVEKIRNKSMLENLTYDFYRKEGLSKKVSALARIGIVKGYKVASSAMGSLLGNNEITGETTSLQVFEELLLKEMSISMDFIREKAEEYSNHIEPRHVEPFKSCEDDIYIVSAEPTQLLDAVVEEIGLSDEISDVYGTEFKIEDGLVKGFKRSNLLAGLRGKHYGMEKVISNGYSKVYAIGDSMADLGLFKEHNGKVIPYTFEDSPKELKDFVNENDGEVVEGIEDFFKHQ